jgi:DnaJ like chaperone protein
MSIGILYLIGALLYVLFPRDLLPDFIVGWGWLDDLVVIYALWRWYRRQLQMRRTANGANQTRQSVDGKGSWNPYKVLEIDSDASTEEIKAAYRRLVAQYHPDKVQHLGREIRELAQERFREIQRAYDELMGN